MQKKGRVLFITNCFLMINKKKEQGYEKRARVRCRSASGQAEPLDGVMEASPRPQPSGQDSSAIVTGEGSRMRDFL